MGIKAGRLANWPYPNILTNIRQGGRQHYPRYMEMAERYCHIRRNFSPHIVFGSVAFLLSNSFTISDRKNSGNSHPRTYLFLNMKLLREALLWLRERIASDTCVRLTSKSVGWFCHLWDTCAQSTLALIGRGSPGWHFTLFDRCNKVSAIRQLWSQNIWPWARFGRYFVPNKLHSRLRSWSVFVEIETWFHADLIFVTNITNIICEEKLSCGEILAFHV